MPKTFLLAVALALPGALEADESSTTAVAFDHVALSVADSVVPEPVKLNKAVHFALRTADFDSLLATLRAMDIEFSNFPGTVGEVSVRADGIRQAFLQDPDGYWIEINSAASH